MRDKSMKDQLNLKLGRRDVFRVFVLGGAISVTTGACTPIDAGQSPDKQKAHYRPDAADVQAFYRVNRYPAK
jgi:hypothetical protein